MGRGGRPRPPGPLRPDRRDRLPDGRPALRRREGQGRPGPALRHRRQPAGDGRADQPPRHLVVRGPRAIDPRVRGDRPGRQPRPLLPQPGRRPADRVSGGRARVIEGDYETYPAPRPGREGTRRGGRDQVRRLVRRERRLPSRVDGGEAQDASSPIARRPTSSARSASSRRRSPSSKTCSASPPPGATRSRPSARRSATSC